jgi:hypothetical protein
VIDLLQRVCTVSVKTVEIIDAMAKEVIVYQVNGHIDFCMSAGMIC